MTAWINYLSVFYTLKYRWILNQSQRVFGKFPLRAVEVTTFCSNSSSKRWGWINITLSEKGRLMATLPANVEGYSAIGFISMWIHSRISAVNVVADCRKLSRRRYSVGIGDEVLSPVMFPGTASITGTDADYYRWYWNIAGRGRC